MRHAVVLWVIAASGALMAPGSVNAGSTEWLGPSASGRAYPPGEEDRQYEMLAYDLSRRDAFRRVAEQAFRPESLIFDSDRDPLDVILRRTEALISDLKSMPKSPDLKQAAAELTSLRGAAAGIDVKDAKARRALFNEACHLRRRVALANPLLDFKDILFVKRQRSCFNHMCDQFYGMAQRPGGGLFVLEDAFGPAPAVRDVLAGALVKNGPLRGQTLSGGPRRHWDLTLDYSGNLHGEETVGGSFLSPDLSYDGQSVAFAYTECRGSRNHIEHTDPARGHWDAGRCFHLFRVGMDGTNLVQLTEGTWNDFQPSWMPSGRIAFISERRGGYLRCGRACPTFTVFDMAPGGHDLRCLSYHETNEWYPSASHDGLLVYTRWDYVDRNGMTTHNPWLMTPDGRGPRPIHANYALRDYRPDMELNVRAIPGSHRFLATAAPHHGQAFGSLVLIDPLVPDDDRMAPVKRLTPEVDFPESQGGTESFGEAWPLSEDYYLCSYDPVQVPALNPAGMGAPGDPGTGYPDRPAPRNPDPKGYYGLYLVDSRGNRELIYRDPEIGCLHPIPMVPRALPPVIPDGSDRLAADRPAEATVFVADVYRSDRAWPAGTKIGALRVYEIIPQSIPSNSTAHTGVPIPDTASVNLARAILGTVPVERDGSAHFTVPARRELYFQALDQDGLAVTSMRSGTHFQPGETASCLGCHEPRHQSPASSRDATPSLAMRRRPSQPSPDVDGTNPFSYPRLVQPVLDQYCVSCHQKSAGKAPALARTPVTFAEGWRPATYYASYLELTPKFGFFSYGASGWLDPKFYRTTPGEFGARASKLYQMLKKGHHDLVLPQDAWHRLSVWLDSCSLFYGVYEIPGQEAQLRGEVVRPTLE
ncbi:hypothetical protein [Aquisphaera insulae]|uniref:HzsA-related protein n=1 Tax=Aquisphaera insulae TaxID=2712864 RepID=UPI0013EC43BE|nr:hypothetical protein [Aquisphaera insulae]